MVIATLAEAVQNESGKISFERRRREYTSLENAHFAYSQRDVTKK